MFSAWWPEVLGSILSWRPEFGDRMMEWLGWCLDGFSKAPVLEGRLYLGLLLIVMVRAVKLKQAFHLV